MAEDRRTCSFCGKPHQATVMVDDEKGGVAMFDACFSCLSEKTHSSKTFTLIDDTIMRPRGPGIALFQFKVLIDGVEQK